MAKKINIVLLAFMLAMLMVIPCSAYDDGSFLINEPDGWNTVSQKYETLDGDGCSFYGMLKLKEENKGAVISGWMVERSTDTYWSMWDEDDAVDMYEDAGRDILENYMLEKRNKTPGEYSVTNEKYLGPDEGYGYIRHKVGKDRYIYLTFKTDNVFYLFDVDLSGHKGDDGLKVCNRIIDSFYDYDYYEMISEDEGSDIIGDIMGVLLVIVIFVISKASLAKQKNEKGPVKKTESSVPVKINRPEIKKRAKHKDVEKETRSVDGTQTTTVHCTYEDSLRTLYKSGLLTRKELNEMLEKHQSRNTGG